MLYEEGYTQNRELSWLRFNERVMDEASDQSVPLLERLKFIEIFTSNLDEFFMIRIGSLVSLRGLKTEIIDQKSGMKPKEQLKKVYRAVERLYKKRDSIFHELSHQLSAYGIYGLTMAELENSEKKYIREYYQQNIAPILSPQIVDTHHPFPHLASKLVHIGTLLRAKNNELFGIIPVPSVLPEVIYLPGKDIRFIAVEQVIEAYAEEIFSMYEVIETTQFCITRNADITVDDEILDTKEDFRKAMKKLLNQRRHLAVVRLELSNCVGEKFEEYLCEHFDIEKQQMYCFSTPMRLGFVYQLGGKLAKQVCRLLSYPEFEPQLTNALDFSQSILKQVSHKDVLLSYPYESMEPFLQMIKEAAYDAHVVSIKMTIYRLASKAKLIEYLCVAAENGKDVTVLIELRARFDEQNNIDWSERLEDAGCKLIYGFEDYKVHSKVCLITRQDKSGIKYITQIGTGNYNEKTAKFYTDLSLMTGNQQIGLDVNHFFKNMAIANLEGEYQELLVAPICLKSRIMDMIDQEIDKGKDGYLLFKLNSFTDADLIRKLCAASCAGVQVVLIIRGICCLLPGVKNKTENITVRNIVGRFLEHSRIYCFGQGEQQKIYISSADFMTRNTERRVEIAVPILEQEPREKIQHILATLLSDNIKAREMDEEGTYCYIDHGEYPINAQEIFLVEAKQHSQPAVPKKDWKEWLREKIDTLID